MPKCCRQMPACGNRCWTSRPRFLSLGGRRDACGQCAHATSSFAAAGHGCRRRVDLSLSSVIRGTQGAEMPTRERVQAFVAMVEANEFVEAISQFYTDDATMQENLGAVRVGRDALVA